MHVKQTLQLGVAD